MLDGMGRCAWAQAVEGCAVSGTIIGIPTAKGPENGNGQVAPEEVKREQEEGKMSSRRHSADENSSYIDEFIENFAKYWGIPAQYLRPSPSIPAHTKSIVYEVTAMDGCEVIDRCLKRAISSEYVDSLLDECDEVRIRKVEIE